ncbi:MAG: hypothetical protein JXQ75_15635 [Phycisphaerae bacterium]|nr:hypothetical protein [Phycisphaerae bacterium]
MSSRDDDILDHIGLYRISFRFIIERLFFQGGNCGNVVQRLMKQKRIQSVDGLPGSLAYYQLTLGEARRRSLPQDRGRALGPRALATHLAILWFCSLAPVPRRRLGENELSQLFGEKPSGCPHVAQAGAKPRVYRIHVVSSRTRAADVIKRLRAEIDAAIQSRQLNSWAGSGRYAFALLTDTASRAQAFTRAVQRAKLDQRVRIVCEGVPSPLTIQDAIHDTRERSRGQASE